MPPPTLAILFISFLLVTTVTSDCPSSLPKLSALPGHGWCNLRNKEMAQVQQFSYHLCKTTPDQLFLIPDNAFVIPLSESKVDLYAEIIDSWKNYSSINAKSINLKADASFGSFAAVSGSFSEDYQKCKRSQVEEKSVTTRVQARYTLYTVGVSVDDPIHPHLRSQLQKAMDALKNKNWEEVDYLLELIVGEYGTHLLTRVDTGGILNQEEYITREYMMNEAASSEVIKVAASARFFSRYGFSSGYSTAANETVMKGYENSVRSSHTQSYGGMLLSPVINMTEGWVDSIPHNPVAIDREGDPLHFIVTPSTFPDESLELVDNLRLKLQVAIGRYFSYNRHIGCMELGAPNFDYNANIDDKMCKESFNNYTLGGIFQTCSEEESWAKFCSDKKLEHKNILTQNFSCPVPYIKVPLMTNVLNDCVSCYWFLTCCSNYTITTFWCAADEAPIANNTGLMFGGLYTSKTDNPMTQSRSCPPTFTTATMFEDLSICIGQDTELGSRFATKFGGFFSCQIGNPMYNRKNLKRLMKSNALPDIHNQTLSKTCPFGYTQHTATVYSDCIVNYCVKAGSFSIYGEMPVVLPPFKNYTGIFSQRESGNGKISSWLIGLIATCSVLTLVAFVGGILIVIQRKKNQGRTPQDENGLLEEDAPVDDN